MTAIDEIIGVVVLYNTGIKESETLISLDKGLKHYSCFMDLVVYDNSKVSLLKKEDLLLFEYLKIQYFHDTDNPGVSRAYNFAAQYGIDLKKKWIWLLDQDSSFPIETISAYISGFRDYPSIRLFAPVLKLKEGRIFSPALYKFKRGFGVKSVSYGVNSLKGISPLNSGMMVDIEAFSVVGGYNEKVGLDFSDFQFIERFKKKFESFCLIDIEVLHSFSDEEEDVKKLNSRFGLYCEGARNCEKTSVLDWIQYFGVVFFRAGSLAWRTRRVLFFRTLFYKFIRG